MSGYDFKVEAERIAKRWSGGFPVVCADEVEEALRKAYAAALREVAESETCDCHDCLMTRAKAIEEGRSDE